MFDTLDTLVTPVTLDATPATSVDGLDAPQTLTRLGHGRRQREQLEYQELALAAHWADLHCDVAAPGSVLPGAERLIRLGGDGTPEVAEFAAAEFGAVLGLSPYAAGLLIGDALDLRHRLRSLWDRIGAGQVKPWIGRRVAHQTRHLSAEAARIVDQKTHRWCATLTWARLQPVIDAAILDADPDHATAVQQTETDRHGVWVNPQDTPGTGTGTCFVRADTTDLAAFDAALTRVAGDLATLGDDRSRDHRRATAIGVLADPQHALDLHHHATTDPDPAGPGQPTHTGTGTGTGSGPETVLYIHLAEEALRRLTSPPNGTTTSGTTTSGTTTGAGTPRLGRVEGIGPVLTDMIRTWLGQPDRRLTVKPVLDLTDQTPVDAYEIPDRHRETIHHRTPADCFPYATSTNRHLDHDHTNPYVHADDETWTPGQTRPDNLGKLTRFHHRIKTHSRWTVTQPIPGHHLWTSPHGHTWLVNHTGTHPLN